MWGMRGSVCETELGSLMLSTKSAPRNTFWGNFPHFPSSFIEPGMTEEGVWCRQVGQACAGSVDTGLNVENSFGKSGLVGNNHWGALEVK